MVLNLRKLDLNLLVVFDAIADERSVTRAAAKLHMTQPAISHALGRLRIALGDDLFVRTPEGMEPTPFALRLSGSVRTALRGIQAGLLDASIFDPATSERSFSIAVDNRSALVLTAPITAAVSAEGPGIRLDLRPSGTLNLPEQLDRGDLDLALGGLASSNERFRDLKLFDDGFVALVRVGHPAALGEMIGIHALGEFPHLILSSTGEDSDFVDDELAAHGLARRVALRAPLLAAGSTLAQSNLIAILGERIARTFARTTPLAVLRLPFVSPRSNLAMLWHRRNDDLRAHRWLRDVVMRVARTA
ncbi:LysR family transcriptional regulator [Lichenifustis flavocetrariae]|uniref:LysR family transcriptional regulator n=1 Tax=Lichenifustis flavocetrariae TaxID=2949735 RepID=A0AA42CLN9_9HYPH|nr:LysR family transcriptional regulator [Lichenifustis flavocetrariae]MCW6511824.1 LysR family transcriptional regulator [Lichenifustis flavocetrariae]